jgi:anti-sigma factor RsiW
MTNENTPLADTTSIDEELVAYLDGELSPEDATRVERRMAEDPRYNARLNQLQRAWDLLDTLQRTEADDQFVHSTVAMVAVHATEDAKSQQMKTVRNRSLAWLALVGLVLVSAAVTYGVVQRRLSRPNLQLVRDLPVIERVDEYRNIDSLDFLKQLARENLFASEVDDEP